MAVRERESLLGEQDIFYPSFTGCISESTDILSITNFDQKKFLEIIFSHPPTRSTNNDIERSQHNFLFTT